MSDSRAATGRQDADLHARRRDALRQVLHARRFRESLALRVQPSLRNSALAGLQAALAAAISASLFLFSPWPHLAGFAALGTLAALFGRFATRPRRNAHFRRTGSGLWVNCLSWRRASRSRMPRTVGCWRDTIVRPIRAADIHPERPKKKRKARAFLKAHHGGALILPVLSFA